MASFTGRRLKSGEDLPQPCHQSVTVLIVTLEPAFLAVAILV